MYIKKLLNIFSVLLIVSIILTLFFPLIANKTDATAIGYGILLPMLGINLLIYLVLYFFNKLANIKEQAQSIDYSDNKNRIKMVIAILVAIGSVIVIALNFLNMNG